MGPRWECSLGRLYEDYLEWFQAHAKPGTAPVEQEQMTRLQTTDVDLFEDRRRIFSRATYHVPIQAADSLSGQTELFAFSVLYLLEKGAAGSDPNAVLRTTALEYRRE